MAEVRIHEVFEQECLDRLRALEEKHGMSSEVFYSLHQAGEFDEFEFHLWAILYEYAKELEIR